ncbi:MAG: hypothetical protein IPG96_01385 [Proteobacteria bacterium]|nr:hypothetical protein [Pseudomonadota bacterium]
MGLFDKLKKGVSSLAGAAMAPAPREEEPAAVEDEPEAAAQEDDRAAARAEWSVNNSMGWARYLDAAERDDDDKERARLDHESMCVACSPSFGSLDPDDLETFCLIGFELEEAEAEDSTALEAKLREHGLSGKEEWWRIVASFIVHHYRDLPREEAADRHVQAMANARFRQQANATQRAAAADPTLLAPFEGVTVEGWAKAAAALGSETDAGRQAQLLLRLGMDAAKWQRVNDEFQARMQRDTSFVIAQAFGAAFTQAQTGAVGAGGGAGQSGDEPVSFERYAEIMGAMGAWGQSGADVNANLKQHFGITAMDISKIAAFWNTRFQADVKLMIKHGELMTKYQEQYAGAGGHDDDLAV